MDTLNIKINAIRNIVTAELEIPLERGVYGLVGNNGCGKSTVLLCLAQLISKHYLGTLKSEDFDNTSFVEFRYNGQVDKWVKKKSLWSSSIYPKTIGFNGLMKGVCFMEPDLTIQE